MKKKILKIMVFGIAVSGILTVAYGASKNKDLNNNAYISSNLNNSQNITMEKAKSIALSQVPGANESHFGEIDLDYDHGMMVYEIEIFYNNSKYEFDIDASTGEIIGTEVKHYNRNY